MFVDLLLPSVAFARRLLPSDRVFIPEQQEFRDTEPSVVWRDSEVLGDEAAWVPPATMPEC
jgi:hypothetical protein